MGTQAVREHRLTPLNHLMFEFQYYQSRIRRGGPTKILCWHPRLGSATPFPRRRGRKVLVLPYVICALIKLQLLVHIYAEAVKILGLIFKSPFQTTPSTPRSFSGGNGVTAPLMCDPRLVVSAFFYRNDRGVQ